MSHRGVDVAPQIPTDLAPSSQSARSSVAFESRCVRGFSLRQWLKSTLPLLLLVPATKSMVGAVAHLTAYRVVIFEVGPGGDASLDFGDYAAKPFEALRRLRKKRYGPGVVKALKSFGSFHHDSLALCLAYEAVDFGMAVFSVYHYLRPARRVVGLFDALLESEHHRAGGINYADTALFGPAVCFGRLAVGAKQHRRALGKMRQLLVGDGPKALVPQTLHLIRVVHDITETAKSFARILKPVQMLFGLAYCRDYAEAEARLRVNLYLVHRRRRS